MTDKASALRLHPHLIVDDAARAIQFYKDALGAEETTRYTAPGGKIVHAKLAVGGAVLTLAEENRAWKNDAPPSLGGSPVILTLEVEDADAAAARMVEAGATVVFPLADHFYGSRQGRLVDPFGHQWLLSQQIEELSPEEIQHRIEAFKP